MPPSAGEQIMQMLQPPDPSALPPPNFGARAGRPAAAAAAAEDRTADLGELRERLAVLLLANPDPVNGVALAELYQRAHKVDIRPRDFGYSKLDKLLVEKSAALGLAVEIEPGVKTTAATVWVKRKQAAAPPPRPAAPQRPPPPPPAPAYRSLAAAPPQHAAAYRSAAPPANLNDGRRPGDWICPSCRANVFASKSACFRCGTRRATAAPEPQHSYGGGGGRAAGGQRGRVGGRGRGGGPPFVPTPIRDDGVYYEGPKMTFVRGGTGEASDDDDEDDDDEEEEVATAGAAPADADAKKPLSRQDLLRRVDKPAAGRQLGVGEEGEYVAGEVGYALLRRLGWSDGEGLGRGGVGRVVPVGAGMTQLLEGVGLGCVDIPEEKLMKSNVMERILDFVADPTADELEFEPSLAKTDRALVHTLAGKHGLGHRSKGKGEARFITVFKRARGAGEAEMAAHYDQVKGSGYSESKRGFGLGFGGYTAAPPPASLLRMCTDAALSKHEAKRPVAPPKATPRTKVDLGGSAAVARDEAPATPAPAAAAAGGKKGLEQWASSVIAFSSQFSAADNSAMQVLGPSRVYPRGAAGGRSGGGASHVKAWSAVPRPGETKEWVRLGFKTAVVATSVEVYETFSPGSVAAIRLADATDETGDWVEVWRRADGEPNAAAPEACRCFAPALGAAAASLVACAVEVELDTSGWGEQLWSEIDAVKLVGAPPPPLKEGALGAFMGKQPWESERAHAARAQAAQRAMPAGASAESDDAQMRRAALSMVWANAKLLGCRYPAEVEAAAGVRRAGEALSGYAVESALRAAE